jgi:hypothetical protein
MAEIYCQIIYSDRLAQQRGEAYWRALLATKLPVRTWAADSYESPDDRLRQACDRGEPAVLAFDGEEWIVGADWETGTLSITADVNITPATSPAQMNRVRAPMESLFELLRPRFAWADLKRPYPDGLAKDVLESDIHWIFWLNYYGSAYLSKYGARFFQTAPFESVRMISDIGVRCLTADAPGTANPARIRDLTSYFAAASIKTIAYGG